MKRQAIGNLIRWTGNERGSLFLLGMLVIVVMLLLFSGAASSTLTQQVHTTHAALLRDSRVLARDAIELVLYSRNYVDTTGTYTGPGWSGVNPVYTYTPAALQAPNQVVFATVTDNHVADITIQGTAILNGVTQTATVTVDQPGGTPPGIFYYGVYTNGINEPLRAWGESGSIVFSGYNSNVGNWSGAFGVGNDAPTRISTDTDPGPWAQSTWLTLTGAARKDASTAIVVDGNVNLHGSIEIGAPITGVPGADPCPWGAGGCVSAVPVYGTVNGVPSGPGTATVTGTAIVVPGRYTAPNLGAPPANPWAGGAPAMIGLNTSTFGPGAPFPYNTITQYMFCSKEDLAGVNGLEVTSLENLGGTVYIGCDGTLPASSPASCAYPHFKYADSDYHSCNDLVGGTGNPDTDPVVLSIGQAASSALKVGSEGGQPGQIRLLNRARIYLNGPGASGKSVELLSMGIQNQVLKPFGNPDPAALRIFGLTGSASTMLFNPAPGAPAFHGVVYDPAAKVDIRTGNFFGAFNVDAFTTEFATGSVSIVHDTSLNNQFPGPGTAGCAPASAPGNPCVPKDYNIP